MNSFITQLFCISTATHKPQQLLGYSTPKDSLCCEEGEDVVTQAKSHLSTKDGNCSCTYKENYLNLINNWHDFFSKLSLWKRKKIFSNTTFKLKNELEPVYQTLQFVVFSCNNKPRHSPITNPLKNKPIEKTFVTERYNPQGY